MDTTNNVVETTIKSFFGGITGVVGVFIGVTFLCALCIWFVYSINYGKDNNTNIVNPVKDIDKNMIENKPTNEKLKVGGSFDIDGVKYTYLEVNRQNTKSPDIGDSIIRDSKLGIKIKVENTSDKDYYYNSLDLTINSKVRQSDITTVVFLGDNLNFQPVLEGQTLISGAVAEGWVTYFMPSEITNSDLRVMFNDWSNEVIFEIPE